MVNTRFQSAQFLIYLTALVLALVVAESASRKFTGWYMRRELAGRAHGNQ